MKRLTKKQIKKIKILYQQKKALRKIAEILGVSHTTVSYHINPEKRKESSRKYWSRMSKKQRKKYYKNRREQRRIYFNKRYSEDNEFRERHKQMVKQNYRRKNEIK
jgi:DNA-binding transcriptional ArsR family regulator